ncbi:MAG: hypothetical protein WBW01_17760 [Terriglobales bacterium]
MPVARNQFRWFYWPPLIHLAICLVATLGYIVPGLQFLGILWSIVTIADLPVSLVTMILTFGPHSGLAPVWAIVAGTLWWYLVCRAASFLAAQIRASTLGRSTES